MVSLRPAKHEDCGFLWRLHCSAMKPYVEATWGWDDDWQQKRFREQFGKQVPQIIELEGQAIGALSLEAKDGGTFLANVSIRPEYQRRGIGTTVIQHVLDEVKQPVFLQVLKVNPAKQLYSRLGFRLVGETGTHFLMTRDPFPVSENLNDADGELIAVARDVLRRNYHAERHTVAAAARCLSGQIYTGINIESCGYGPCAEPIAMGAAFTHGERGLSAIAAVGKHGDDYPVLSPCGNCRQLVVDYAPEAWVVFADKGRELKRLARELLPGNYKNFDENL